MHAEVCEAEVSQCLILSKCLAKKSTHAHTHVPKSRESKYGKTLTVVKFGCWAFG